MECSTLWRGSSPAVYRAVTPGSAQKRAEKTGLGRGRQTGEMWLLLPWLRFGPAGWGNTQADSDEEMNLDS